MSLAYGTKRGIDQPCSTGRSTRIADDKPTCRDPPEVLELPVVHN